MASTDFITSPLKSIRSFTAFSFKKLATSSGGMMFEHFIFASLSTPNSLRQDLNRQMEKPLPLQRFFLKKTYARKG
ncbi:MAG: hypothetical protein OM95_14820 [Bdellovibrio sp. ArHS]|nr:MAG: hypothetical protein OM95_14820 [Bdellovibrio sp. ArHS]